VSLENCRHLDPQTRIVMFSRLDVSPAETPRWRRIPVGGIPATPRKRDTGTAMSLAAVFSQNVSGP